MKYWRHLLWALLIILNWFQNLRFKMLKFFTFYATNITPKDEKNKNLPKEFCNFAAEFSKNDNEQED